VDRRYNACAVSGRAVLLNERGRALRICEQRDAAVDHQGHISLALEDQAVQLRITPVGIETDREESPVRLGRWIWWCHCRYSNPGQRISLAG